MENIFAIAVLLGLLFTLASGITLEQTVNRFAVSLAWLGKGEPGLQTYDIVDPDIFATIESGEILSIILSPRALKLSVIDLSILIEPYFLTGE